MRSNKIRKSKSEFLVHMFFFTFYGLVALSYVLLYAIGFMQGLKSHTEIAIKPFAFPEIWRFRNYIDAFTMLEVDKTNMIGMIGNSLIMMLGGGALSILAPTLMAYAFTKFRFHGRTVLMTINILTIMIPIMGNLGAAYRLYSAFGFINSRTILITYWGGFGANTLFLCAFFKNVSNGYMEAARIDGANNYKIMFQIMLPLAMGPVLALGVMTSCSIWNDYMSSLLFYPKMPTLATGIYLFKTQMIYRARMDILMAATMLSSIPILLCYVVFNKAILTNVSFGGFKG